MFAARIFARSFAVSAAKRGVSNFRQVRRGSANAGRILFYVGAVGTASLIAGSVSEAAPAVNYDAVRKDIIAAIDAEDAKREDGSSVQGTLIRLAWHASGTYDCVSKTGGSNGSTMRMKPECAWGANAGLGSARSFLEPIKAKHPGLSYADLWTLAGAVAVENMGGPSIPWRGGRTDSPTPTKVPDGRLPNADMGSPKATAAHIREIFNRMGFVKDREIVALIGAHAVGRCHTNASGYWGPWTYAESTFSNEFFRLLLSENWQVKKTHEGKPWTGPLQYETPDGKLMMTPADLALCQDREFRQWVSLYAKDEEAFFKDFADVFSKLMELGVTFPEGEAAATGKSAKKGLFGLGFLGL